MSALNLVRQSAGMRMVDEDGEEDVLRLLPPVSAQELAALEAGLPGPLPASVRELLMFTRGFENGPLESVDFVRMSDAFGMEEVFPHALPLAHDGSGNFWIADLQPDSMDWAPIYFACHDPPVIAFQSNSLEHFIAEVLRSANPPHESDVENVRVNVAMDIWARNPGTIDVRAAASSSDGALRTFAASLDDSYSIIDLRGARVGDGFSWGRYGARTTIVRHGREPIFAYQKKSRWQRFIGR